MKSLLLRALDKNGLTDEFKAYCTPDRMRSEAVQWVKEKTGTPYTSDQVTKARHDLDCPGKRGGKRPAPRMQPKILVGRRDWR